jgi:signal transduction histidine kinase
VKGEWRLHVAGALVGTGALIEGFNTLDSHGIHLLFGIIRYDLLCIALYLVYAHHKSSVKEQKERYDAIVSELQHKNSYLEHAAKILRHDMHSGINTYIPRGISSLERRLTPEAVKEYKLDAPLRLLKEGLSHTQKIYKGVKEFTNLVKQGAALEKTECDLRSILVNYLDSTSYKDQVAIDWLPTVSVNEPLFCTAVDNLIRNGLKYNDSEMKLVAVFMLDDNHICIQDNGRGMSQEEFENYSKPYVRKENQKEKGSGLGLNICIAILQEHGFSVACEKLDQGTRIKVKIR